MWKSTFFVKKLTGKMIRNIPQWLVVKEKVRAMKKDPLNILVLDTRIFSRAFGYVLMLEGEGDIRVTAVFNNIEEMKEAEKGKIHLSEVNEEIVLPLLREKGEQRGQHFFINEAYKKNMTFQHCDLTKLEKIKGTFDVISCQNTLIGKEAICDQVLSSCVSLLNKKGILLVGGSPLGQTTNVLMKSGLHPIMNQSKQIHESWSTRRSFFHNKERPWWALEPYDVDHAEGEERYCTIFEKR